MPKSLAIEKKADEISVQVPMTEEPGICPSCDNSPTCVYLKAHGGVVTYCEEYFGVSATEPQRPVRKAETRNIQAQQVKGLCVNCEKNKTCGYARPAEGIWHCEEYE